MAVGRFVKPPVQLQELEALTGALNRSGERVQKLWLSFLILTLYFALAAGTTTHRMLLLQEGLSLPLVNLKLPLLGFYIIAPVFYVVLHGYFLMMLVLLARTAKTFKDALEKLLPGDKNEAARESFRMRIENALFLQIIIGAQRERGQTAERKMRRISRDGLDLIRRFESFSPAIYICPAGYPTIGYGHLITEAHKAQFLDGVDEPQAQELLQQDMQKAEHAVLRLITVPLMQGQFDALASFTFNLGAGALQRSTLRRCVNREEHTSVPAQLMKWVWAGGRKLKGLVRRRAAECDLYQLS